MINTDFLVILHKPDGRGYHAIGCTGLKAGLRFLGTRLCPVAGSTAPTLGAGLRAGGVFAMLYCAPAYGF